MGIREVLVKVIYNGQVWYDVEQRETKTMGKTHETRRVREGPVDPRAIDEGLDT